MSIDYNMLAIPKGKTRKQLKARKDRADAKALKQFRDLCWAREAMKSGYPAPYVFALCEHCHRLVGRFSTLTGEVHHRISRRHTATRYDQDNGVLLCNHLVNGCHEKAERGLIQV